MLELIVDVAKERKVISLLDSGKLIETYEENDKTKMLEGNIYIGTVKDIVQGMQSAFIDIGTEKKSFIHLKDILPKSDEKGKENVPNIDIKKAIKVNDKLLVQVKKDSTEKKGARVSTHISLPSRYMVYMPNTEIITISKKIEDEKERERLLKIIQNNLPKGNGAIIRTSAKGKTEKEIVQDIEKVEKQWNNINKKYQEKKESEEKLIFEGYGIIEKIIIDMLDKKLEKITVNNKKEYEKIIKFVKSIDEKETIKVELKGKQNLLETYDIERQIEKINSRKIWLNCGGFITIDYTEALTAIDVNTGKFTGKKELEETIYKVNSEATIEIVKQLRLRDIGGIIIIDYIDMLKEENKEKITTLLKEKLKEDRAKTQVEGFTKLNLMELTRKHICSKAEN